MKIVVTGANGHLGTNIVAELLRAGHTVRGSLRHASDPSRTAHLRALGSVELVEADLDNAISMRAAMDGQDMVVHAAAVYELFSLGRENEILRSSIDGVATAMKAAKDARVRRFVLTSSTVALPLTRPGQPAVDETHWAQDISVPYVRAKTEAEGRAWELSDELKLDLATVLPGACGGPGFQRNTPTIDFIETIMKGALQLCAPPINYPYVDVRDVARAHRLVLESGLSGRFIAVNDRQPTVSEIAQTMHAIDPKIPRPLFTFPSAMMPAVPFFEAIASRIGGTARSMTPELARMLSGRVWNISNEKIRRALDWSPEISIKQSLADTIAALREKAVAR